MLTWVFSAKKKKEKKVKWGNKLGPKKAASITNLNQKKLKSLFNTTYIFILNMVLLSSSCFIASQK
jgi:hypothetical protein